MIKESIKSKNTMQNKNNSSSHHHTALDGLFRYADLLGLSDIHIKFDPETGLKAIVVIHNLRLGPAIGGCRMVPYANTDAALEDAMRLAYMMSYKAAISNLPHGGAKAVLIQPKIVRDRKAYFTAFGEFVNELGGSYITAVDSGTSTEDMDIIATRTPFVTCTTASGNGGDPSPQTSLGVCRGIEAAVKFKLDKDTLEGVHIAIQGAGHVGYKLAKEVIARGARVTMCDINERTLQRVADELKINICSPEAIYDLEADVFAPCALGAVLNLYTIKRLRVPIVAGSANNQLAHQHHGVLLHERGILYAPDYVINAGGLIYVSAIYDHADSKKAEQQVKDIYHTSMAIFERAKRENLSTSEVATMMALEKLYG